MPQRAVIDAGPIVGFLVSCDEHHRWAVDQFARFDRFWTCEAVLAEACARIAYYGSDPARVIELVTRGALTVSFSLPPHLERVDRLMRKYADRPMDFADACLVVMTEQFYDSLVVTVDHNDFSSYRRHSRERIPFVSPKRRSP